MSTDTEAYAEIRSEVAVLATAALPIAAAEEIFSLVEAPEHLGEDALADGFKAVSEQASAVYQLPGATSGSGWGPEFAENFRALLSSDDDVADAFTSDKSRFRSWDQGGDLVDGQAPFFVCQEFWSEVGALVASMRERDTEVATQIVALNAVALLPAMRSALAMEGNTKVTSLAGGMRSLIRFWRDHPDRDQIATMSDDTLAKYTLRMLLELSDSDGPEPIFSSLDDVHSSFDFEIWCAEKMTMMGYPAHLRPQGDKAGVDVLANVDGKNIGIRCHFHSPAPGVCAVTEALQGNEKYDLDQVAVVFINSVPADLAQKAENAGVVILKADAIEHLKEAVSSSMNAHKSQKAPHLI